MIEKLVLGEIWTGDLPIFNPDALTSAPSWQAEWRGLITKTFELYQFSRNPWNLQLTRQSSV